MRIEALRASARRLGRTLLLFAALLVCRCQSAREAPTGGETHFLRPCNAGADCGGELACLCGVCTLECSDMATCAKLPAASCVARSAADACQEPSAGRCDVTCTTDQDCASLPTAARCAAGVCRGGIERATCPVNGDEVVLVGDSFFAADHRITGFLEDMARQSGALAAGERYRDHSSLFGNTLALLGSGIEAQYAAAVAESPVGVVIMNGGGADVLMGSCEVLAPDCPLLAEAAAAASSLFQRMAADGIHRIVYAFYPDPADATLRAELDALRPLLASACRASPAPCQFVDLRATFAGRELLYLDADGTRPTAEGAQVSAAAIWAAQPQCSAQ